MMWLLAIDAFCIGLFTGALIVYLDVRHVAKQEVIKMIRKRGL